MQSGETASENRERLISENIRLSERISELEETLHLHECEKLLWSTRNVCDSEEKKGRTPLPEVICGLQLARLEILASNDLITREQRPATAGLVEISEEESKLVNTKLFEGDIDLADIIGLSSIFSTSSSMSTLVSDDSHADIICDQETQEKRIDRRILNMELRSLELKRKHEKATTCQ